MGAPGQGKSVLAKAIVSELERSTKEPDVPVIYFFCYNQEPGFRTPPSVLRALIVQLLEMPEMFAHLPDSLRASQSEFVSASLATLWEIFETMTSAGGLRKLFCIIDALDECEDPQGEISSRLSDLTVQRDGTAAKAGPILKMLVSSRPANDRIQHDFQRFPTWTLRANKQDLDYYMQAKLAGLHRFSSEHKNLAAKRLQQGRDRSFLWLSVVSKKLAQVSLPTTHKIESIIDEIPTELYRLYKNLLDQLKDTNQDDVLKMLLWVAYAKESLYIGDLEVAVSLDLGRDLRNLQQLERYRVNLTPNRITEGAGTLVEVVEEKPKHKVHFIHQSIKDYIVQENSSQSLGILRGEVSPDLYLSRVSMEYLDFEDWRDEPLDTNKMRKLYEQGLFIYAVSYWFKHISSWHGLCQAILSNLDVLISPKPGHIPGWLKAYTFFDEPSTMLDCPLSMYTRGHHEMAYRSLANGDPDEIELVFQLRKGPPRANASIQEHLMSMDCPLSLFMRCPQLSIAVGLCSTWLLKYVLESKRYEIGKFDLRDALAESAKRPSVVFEMVLDAWENESKDDVAELDGVLEKVAVNGRPNNMELLLERHEVHPITEEVLMAAISNESHSREMTAVLLSTMRLAYSEADVTKRACNRELEQDPLALDSAQARGGKITERVLVTAASKGNEETMALLLEESQSIPITEHVLRAAVGNLYHGEALVTMFLTRSKQTIQDLEEIMIVGAQNSLCGDGIIRSLQGYSEQKLPITASVMRAALQSVPCSTYAAVQLLEIANRENRLNEEILAAAVTSYQESVLKALRDQVNLDNYNPRWRRLVEFTLAAYGEDHNLIRKLLVDGVEYNLPDDNGKTLLWRAASEGNLEVMKILLDLDDINIESRDRMEGLMPLYLAVQGGCKSCAKLLMERGADPHAECRGHDFHGKTTPFLEVKASYGRSLEEWVEEDDGVEHLQVARPDGW